MFLPSVLTIALIALGSVATLYIVSSWALARLWCKPKRLPITKTPADFKLSFEAIQFSSHGVPIQGWFIPAARNASLQPVLVLAHGWCTNAAELLLLARVLHKANFALLLYDARGHGDSGDDGPITILKLAEDIVAGVDYLATRTDIDTSRLGVLGRSLGGSAAIVAASRERRIRAVVSCSAFADPKALTRDFLAMLHVPARLFSRPVFRFIERWLKTTMDDVAPQNRVGQITAPLLLIHGAADRYIRPSNLETLYARAPRERTQRLLVPNRGHSDVLRDVKCGQEIVAFFRRNLLPDGYPVAPESDLLTQVEWEQAEAK
ncbi:MAG TPA: alpha/beta fold hydrolase [Anaerolineae bacterium]|nr:alpha/beta fold hydrolase [Anaerolineae bacterium]